MTADRNHENVIHFSIRCSFWCSAPVLWLILALFLGPKRGMVVLTSSPPNWGCNVPNLFQFSRLPIPIRSGVSPSVETKTCALQCDTFPSCKRIDLFCRTMDYSARRGIANACRPSVSLSLRLSVPLVDQDHVGLKYWKLTARTIAQHLRSS